MTRVALVLLVACAATACATDSQSTETRSQTSTGGASVDDADADADPETDPETEPATGDAATSDSPIPITYYIDGQQVDEATFHALLARLTIDEEPFEGETVENPDGTYGGASESFHAREGEVQYVYVNATFRGEDDTVGESRSLRRVQPDP